MSEQQQNPANETSAVEVQQFPAHFQARVVGKVQYRNGDGPLEDIPVDTQLSVETALASYVLSWSSGPDQQPVTVYLAKRELELYVENGALQVSA